MNPDFDETQVQPEETAPVFPQPEEAEAPVDTQPQLTDEQEVFCSEAPSEPTPDAPSPKKEKAPITAGKVIAIALCCSLLGGILGGIGVNLVTGGKSDSKSPNNATFIEGDRESTVIDINTVDTSKLMTPAEVYATNVNSTVGITTSVTTNFWGFQTTSAASGSGFILSEDGYILTNHHVIEDSNSITVSFYDGSSAEAKLIGYDASNDIAVLKVEAEGLTPVILGDSDNMNVGDSVVAIGNPLGELTFSLTAGAVSALSRDVTTSAGVTMKLMQTDCAINSGNSGGALFNLYGEVIGITNAKYSSSNSSSEASIDNIGFAIPVNNIRSIVSSIIEKGYISKPYVGISVSDVSADAQRYGLPKGAAVGQVVEGSPAEAAGVQVNDIITHVNGTEVSGSSDLVAIVQAAAIGDKLTFTVYRMNQTLELEVTVGENQQAAIEAPTQSATEPDTSSGSFGNFPWGFGGFGY